MNLYAIFYASPETGRPMWAMSRNKRAALKAGRAHRALVTYLPNAFGCGSAPVWDAPTLRAVSNVLADFRETR